jgi:large subunit ribosomal protein L3
VAIELLCRKIGTTRIYDDQGQAVAVTVLEAGPNVVVQKKTEAKEGYTALQLGFGDRRPTRTPKPLAGHFAKANVAPKRHLSESRVGAEDAAKYEVGQELPVELFAAGQRVDVVATSKGRGTQGVVKRHNFPVHRWTHGGHEYFRHGGSIGPGSFPGRVIKGLRMAGRLGNARTTTRNVMVVRVDADRRLLYLRGSVPGHAEGVVRVRAAVAPRGAAARKARAGGKKK